MRRAFLPLTVLLLVSFILVGCGGGSSATATTAKPATAPASGAATTAPTTAAATQPAASSAAGTTVPAATTAPAATSSGGTTASGGTIKLGMITSLTGPYNPLGSFNKQAADLLIKQINDAGGINGAKIDLEIEDDTSNPSAGPTIIKKFIANKVVGIIGPVFSSTCAAILDDVEAAKIPMITQCAADSVVTPIRSNIFLGPQSTRVRGGSVPWLSGRARARRRSSSCTTATEYGSLGWSTLKADAA